MRKQGAQVSLVIYLITDLGKNTEPACNHRDSNDLWSSMLCTIAFLIGKNVIGNIHTETQTKLESMIMRLNL